MKSSPALPTRRIICGENMPDLSKLTNLPKGIFRLWQPHEDAYMLAWNAIVADITSRKLNKENLTPVLLNAGLLCVEHGIDLEDRENWPLGNYFLSLALAEKGILPILDRSPAKWFWLVDPFAANKRLFAHVDEVGQHVIRDLWSKHGVKFEMPAV